MTLFQDVRYGVRVVMKSPGFLVAAVLSLALGIGGNTTIFTMINTVFLQPLPVEKPSELITVYGTDTSNTQNLVLGAFMPLSYPNYVDYKTQNDVFTDLAVYTFPYGVSLAGAEKPTPVNVQLVSGNYFSLLGVNAALGRTFLPEEDKVAGSSAVAVLDYKFWQRQFGSNLRVIGDTIRLNGHPFTVIGVAPRGFDGTIGVIAPDMWAPAMSHTYVVTTRFPGGPLDKNRRLLSFNMFGRLKPSVTMAQAQSSLQTIGRRLEKEYPNENTGRNVGLLLLTQATIPPAIRSTMMQGSGLLMGIVGLVLLIACANIANLMMARATARRREFTVRSALGGARSRLIRQLLVESLIIALPGGGLALLVGVGGRSLIISLLPAVVNPANLNLPMDAAVLAFTVGLSVLSAILFGLAPALRASQFDLASDLKERTGQGSFGGRLKARDILVLFQVALSVVALASAGLFIRSLANAQSIDLGFEHDKLVVLQYNVSSNGYDESRGKDYHRKLLERMRALPGVAAASIAATLPLTPGFQRSVFPEGQENVTNNRGVLVLTNVIAPGYFETVRMPLVRGRDFLDVDREGQPLVVIINEAMARRFWPDQDALGKRFRFFGDSEPRTVVGIVRNAKYVFVGEGPQPMGYTPLEQGYSPAMSLVVRTSSRPDAMKGTVEREVRSLDPDIALTNIQTGSELLAVSLTGPRVAAILLSVFGSVALVLAAIGIYGVMSYSINLRAQEIGIRMALGAERRDVLRMVLRQGMTIVGIGLVVGLIVAMGIGYLLSGLLYGVGAADVPALAGTAALLLVVALIANYVPARRATHVDPIAVMRYE
ncbi:MAG TPA: ABC transporter permease [Terriglobia bacterium]|nr:ABC transporter permease [Terriglobia bacterium]